LRKIEIVVNKATMNFAFFLTRTNVSFQKGTIRKSGHEESTCTSNLEQTTKRAYADMLTEAAGSKKRKGEIASQYDKNTCNLVLL